MPTLIKRCARIRYKLEIEILTEEQELLLKKLQNWIDELDSNSIAKATEDDNLTQQIATKRINHGFFEIHPNGSKDTKMIYLTSEIQ